MNSLKAKPQQDITEFCYHITKKNIRGTEEYPFQNLCDAVDFIVSEIDTLLKLNWKIKNTSYKYHNNNTVINEILLKKEDVDSPIVFHCFEGNEKNHKEKKIFIQQEDTQKDIYIVEKMQSGHVQEFAFLALNDAFGFLFNQFYELIDSRWKIDLNFKKSENESAITHEICLKKQDSCSTFFYHTINFVVKKMNIQ